jgi:hypothetical protein
VRNRLDDPAFSYADQPLPDDALDFDKVAHAAKSKRIHREKRRLERLDESFRDGFVW